MNLVLVLIINTIQMKFRTFFKATLATLLFVGLSFPAFIQAQSGFKIGIIANPAVNTLLNSDDDALINPPQIRKHLLPGMSGGLMLGYNAGAFGIRVNALYGQYGGRISFRNLAGNATLNYRGEDYKADFFTERMEYLKIPLMVGFQTGGFEPPKVQFSFYGGVQANFLTRARRYSDFGVVFSDVPFGATSVPDDYERYANRTFSGVVDFGFDFNMTESLQMNLHLRGEYGFTDAENKDASYRTTEGGRTVENLVYPVGRSDTNVLSAGLVVGITYQFTSRWN